MTFYYVHLAISEAIPNKSDTNKIGSLGTESKVSTYLIPIMKFIWHEFKNA